MDVILVLGPVTAKQYSPLSFAMVKRGLKPRIVRFDQDENATNAGFVAAEANRLLEKEFDVKLMSLEDQERQTEILEENLLTKRINEAFGDIPLSDVRVIVFPYSPEERLLGSWEWLIERLDVEACYTVHLHEKSGSHWLSGWGYGNSLPNLKAL